MASSKAKYGHNADPRLSANQLAEYLLASPVRRQGILRNAKYPPTAIVIRYRDAREAICAFLANDGRSRRILHDAIDNLEKREAADTASQFEKDDARLSIEAIRAFERAYAGNKTPQLVKLQFRQPARRLPRLKRNGVDVSVWLDLIARKANKDGFVQGGTLLQMSKAVSAASWRAEHSRNVATMCWLLSEKHLSKMGEGEVDRKLCIAIDVFGESLTLAPTSYRRRLNDLDAACLEIEALWPHIRPPDDFLS